MAKELNIQAIRQAQEGNSQNLSEVAEQVRQKVYTYIYRLTLDYHLTQDLTQETALEMIKSLSELKVPHVNGFWGWIFRTALESIPPILNSAPEFHPTRNACSSPGVTGGGRIRVAIHRISTGLNSRNIYPNPIDSLKAYKKGKWPI